MRRRLARGPVRVSAAELVSLVGARELEGQALHVRVLHDDRCSPLACRCTPDLIIEPLTPATYAAGQAAQARWAREAVS